MNIEKYIIKFYQSSMNALNNKVLISEGCSEIMHLENYRFYYKEWDITHSDTFVSPLEAMEACVKGL